MTVLEPNARRASAWLYGALLYLCPVQLRREFGGEICTVFTEDLDEAWQTRGLAGAVGVWWCAVCEVIRMAVPELKANPAIAVPVVSVALNVLVVGAEVLIYVKYVAPPAMGRLSSAFWSGGAIICGTSVLAALAALAVVHGRNSRSVSLGLNSGNTPTARS